jgi:transposase InsO family protein
MGPSLVVRRRRQYRLRRLRLDDLDPGHFGIDHQPSDPTLLALLERCRHDHHAWINGDGTPYSLPEDGTIMGAIGGYSRGGPETAERQAAVARQWISGEGTVDFVNGGTSGDVAWLVMVERGSVQAAGQATTRRWDLRVTEVFRRTEEGWERAHRHADPLVDRHHLGQLLDLQDGGASY